MNNNFLTFFDLKPLEESVYRVLLVNSVLSATELAQKAGVSRTSVYDILTRLIEKGLVIEIREMDKKLFAIQPLEKIELLLKEKEEALKMAQNIVAELKDKRVKDVTEQPRLLVFRGKKALQEMMKDIFLYPEEIIYSYSPPQKIFQTLGAKFMNDFHKKRILNNMRIKVIWPQAEIDILKKYPFLIPGINKKREARSLVTSSAFPLGYMIYGNNVSFISSKEETFGFIVRSRELAETMKGQFDVLWEISKKL